MSHNMNNFKIHDVFLAPHSSSKPIFPQNPSIEHTSHSMHPLTLTRSQLHPPPKHITKDIILTIRRRGAVEKRQNLSGPKWSKIVRTAITHSRLSRVKDLSKLMPEKPSLLLF